MVGASPSTDARPARAAAAQGASRERVPVGLVAGTGVAAVAAALLVWWATGPWGAGLSPDAIAYSAIAENIRDHGTVGYWLEPEASSWPPLFPALLALGSALLDVSVVDAGRIVNALCQGATVVLTAVLANRLLRHRWLVALAIVTAAVAQPLVYVSVKVWSEPLFNVLVLALVLVLAGVPGPRPVPRLLGASALVIGASCTRYAGLAFVAGGIAVLAWWPRADTARERWRRALTFALPATAAALALVVWNRVRTSHAFGPRWVPDEPFWAHAADALAAIGGWFVPDDSGRALAMLLGAGMVVAVVLAVAWRPHAGPARALATPESGSSATDDGSPVIGVVPVLAVFVGVYLAYMVWARTTSGFDPLNSRLLLPVFLPCVLVLLGLVDRLAAAVTSPVARWASLALPVLLLAPTLRHGLSELRTSHDTGNEYTNAAVRDVVEGSVVQGLPAECALLSNDPWLVWLGGREAQLSPQSDREVAIPVSMELDELAPMVASTPTCLVWFDTGSTVFHPPEQLAEVVSVDEVASDGFTSVYRLAPRG